MIISQLEYVDGEWQDISVKEHSDKAKLVLLFADRYSLEDASGIKELREKYPNTDIVSVSTSGDFLETALTSETSMSASVIEFEKSSYRIRTLKSSNYTNCRDLGDDIARSMDEDNLEHVILFSEGTGVNGSLIIEGLNQVFRGKVTLTGGLAGDANRFQKTLVGVNDDISHDNVVAIGLYGKSLTIGFGNECGFESFGPLRKITKSYSNVLHEIDNKPALALCKDYLGKHANELPESALWFPLEISTDDDSEKFVRTILNINEE
ncbi:MAG: FIST signal transduction protein, partial [Bacteroidia bacterium]